MNETVIEFPSYMRETFETTLEKVNKKLRKIKGATEVTLLEEVENRRNVSRNGNLEPRYVEFTKITVEMPCADTLKHRGFDYAGTVSTKDGVKTIYSANGENLADIDVFECSHCGHKRRRNVVHVFNHAKKGRFTIGSTCVEEYFGVAVFKALNIFKGFVELIANMDYDEDEYRGSRKTYGFFRNAVYSATLLAYNENNFYSKGDYYNGIPSTAEEVKMMLNDDDFHHKMAVNARNSAEVISHKDLDDLLVAYYGKLDPKSSNFNSNVVNALFSNGILREFLPYKVVGLLVWAVYNALNKKAKAEEKAKENAKKVNAYIGTVGEKITVKNCTLKSVREMGSFSYYGPTSYLLTFDSPEGTVKTFSTNRALTGLEIGATVDLAGKVKKHEEWKGWKSTMLNYSGIAPTDEDIKKEVKANEEKKAKQKVRAKVRKKLALAKNDIIVVPNDAKKEEVFKDEVTIGDYTFVKEYISRGTCDSGTLHSYIVKDGERIPSPLTNCNVFPWGNNVSGYWKKWTDKVLDIMIEYHSDIVEAV
jgi:hypothetical protein